MGKFITFPELLIWMPLLSGIICFLLRNEKSVRTFAFIASLLTLAVSISTLFFTDPKFNSYNYVNYLWLKYLGNSFFVGLDGTGRLLTFLTALSFPIIILATWKNFYKNTSVY